MRESPVTARQHRWKTRQLEAVWARVLRLNRSSFSHQECLCLRCVLWKRCRPAPESQHSKLYPTDNREKSQVSNRLSIAGQGTGEGTSTMQLVNTGQGIVMVSSYLLSSLPLSCILNFRLLKPMYKHPQFGESHTAPMTNLQCDNITSQATM